MSELDELDQVQCAEDCGCHGELTAGRCQEEPWCTACEAVMEKLNELDEGEQR